MLTSGHLLSARVATCWLAAGLLIVAGVGALPADETRPAKGQRVDFARDIQPILSAKCFRCHGPKEQEGQLRLDARAVVFQGGTSGPAIQKGNAQKSLVYQRVAGIGDDDRMPPEGEKLSAAQIELIRRWIDQGARWPDGVGAVATVAQHWAYVGPVRRSPPAVKDTSWPRNAIDYFVLARLEREGLRPAAAADRARLLRRVYLDLIGLPPSPDEVDAFLHDDRPAAYERVVDRLLASPQYGPRWARQWLDLARYADSNGYQADQYREVWPYRDWVVEAIGADMPFDRFTIEQLAGDLLPEPTLAQKIATGFHRCTTCNVEAGVDPEENRVNQLIDRVNTTATVWLGTTLQCAQCHNHKYDPFNQRDYYRLLAYFNNTPLEVKHTTATTYDFYGPKMSLPETDELLARRGELNSQQESLQKQIAQRQAVADREQAEWEQQSASPEDAESAGAEMPPAAIAKILAVQPGRRNAKQKRQLSTYYRDKHHPELKKLTARLAALKKRIAALQPTTTLVMVEMDKARQTRIFKRGNFLTPDAPVAAGIPRAMPAAAADLPASRLGLARWLVSPANPLVARVTVNRWWQEFTGRGLVATSEDFGTQGEPPSHPKLLDWLAVELIERGWSRKQIHRLIVTSATYRQSSRTTPELLARDPYNRLYARGSRFRLPAETVRDNALVASGLLSHTMGGPPIFPPQPPGVWRHVGRNAPKYIASKGDDRFRRGLYVIWRRSAPFASFVNFDAPDRASCVVKRSRTNTPLQALTLLNDEAYVEMAHALARRIMTERPEASVAERIEYGFRLCLARRPRTEEAKLLVEVFEQELARFRAAPDKATVLLAKRKRPPGVETEELAAWFFVANILLNLDETITRG